MRYADMARHRLVISENAESITAPRSWSMDITYNETVINENLLVTDPFTDNEERECQWYLDNFAATEPDSVGRAAGIAERLRKYGANLFDQLHLSDAITKFDNGNSPI